MRSFHALSINNKHERTSTTRTAEYKHENYENYTVKIDYGVIVTRSKIIAFLFPTTK